LGNRPWLSTYELSRKKTNVEHQENASGWFERHRALAASWMECRDALSKCIRGPDLHSVFKSMVVRFFIRSRCDVDPLELSESRQNLWPHWKAFQ